MKNKVVTFGEIMLRLATPGYLRFSQADTFSIIYGGGEANVAASLANFDVPVDFVTKLPDNEIGRACLMNLRKQGIGTKNIILGGNRLGIYFLETGAVNRGSKVVYDRDNSSFSEIKKGMLDWNHIFEGVSWFHWTGITPAVSQGAADVCLEAIKKANELGITVSCDLNFRKKLWNYGKTASEVMPELVSGCDIILGNEEDVAVIFGIKPEGIDITGGKVFGEAYRLVSEKLMNRFVRCKKVITTLRGSVNANHNSWSGVLWNGKDFFEAPVYQITHIVDRVGGGDAFMGGLIYGLINFPGDDQKALSFAVAASCLKHTVYGDFNQVSVDEVEKLMGGDSSGRVTR